RLASPFWVIPPIAVFVGLSWMFERTSRRSHYVRRALAYYEYGLARLEDRWAGGGIAGTAYLDEGHPYAADLDLFGPASLFERWCAAHPRGGRARLAGWLRSPASPEDIRTRQTAVRDLRDRLDWREQLAVLGGDVPDGIDTATLAAWGTALSRVASPWPRRIAPFLVGLTLLTLAGGVADWFPSLPAALALLVQSGFALWLRPRVRQALAGLEMRARDLFHLAQILTCIEREAFTAPRLVQLQAS